MIDKLTGIWLALWRRAAPRARVHQSGLVVRPYAADSAMRGIMTWRPDWKTRAIASVLEARSGALIDVGANVGQTLLDFLSAPVRSAYVGFEPNIACCQHLAELVSANRLADCQIIPAGLADRTGLATLYRFGGDTDPGASMLRNLRPSLPARASSICVFRLDDLPDLVESGIALVKIDVEGGELEALRGMEATLRRTGAWVICEVLHRDASADPEPYRRRCEELARFVTGLGYTIHRLVLDRAASGIRDLERMDSFPDKAWVDGESERACDYLLVPAADSESARRVLVR